MAAQDKLTEWPKELMLRDAKVYDDLGGLGQRIFTTAGVGEKVKYVRADLVQSHDVETAQAQPPAASVPGELDEPLEGVLNYEQELSFADGWNACRKAMLATQEESQNE